MTSEEYKIISNILMAVETGGQVYGKGRLGDVKKPAIGLEVTLTLGAWQFYGDEGQQLMQMILEKAPSEFRKIDAGGDIEKSLSTSWVKKKYVPSDAICNKIQRIITSDAGISCQYDLIKIRIDKYLASAYEFGVDKNSVDVLCMWVEIAHLGGSAVQRIFKKIQKPYTVDKVMEALKKDQSDTSSSNQVGDKLYWSRHEAVVKMIKEHLKETKPPEPAPVVGYDVNKLIAVLEAEVGYLEKKSNSQLDSKTANVGSANYTKYWRDMKPAWQGQPWCDVFADWAFVQAYGLAAAQELECGGCGIYYTPDSAQCYKNKGQWFSTPKVGDQVFFKNSVRIHHTGIVVAVNGGNITTIEGNTSGGSSVVANGGGVFKKSYNWTSNSNIAGFGRPNYGNSPAPVVVNKELVKFGQKCLNESYGSGLAVDGDYGKLSKNSFVKALQTALNKVYKAGLEVDGSYGDLTAAAVKKNSLKQGMHNEVVGVLQIGLYLHGIDPNGYDRNFGSGCRAAVVKFQNSVGIAADGIAGNDTFRALAR